MSLPPATTYSRSELDILLLLHFNPGSSSAFLEESLSFDQPFVSRVLKKLLSKDCIRRLKSKSRGQRFSYLYYIKPGLGISSLLSSIDLEIDSTLSSNFSRHSNLFRLLAALYDLDTESLGKIVTLAQEIYSSKINSSSAFPHSSGSVSSFNPNTTDHKLKRRNRLAAYCWRYFTRRLS